MTILTCLLGTSHRIQDDAIIANAHQLFRSPANTRTMLAILKHLDGTTDLYSMGIGDFQKTIFDFWDGFAVPHVRGKFQFNVQLTTETITLACADKRFVTLTAQSQHEMQAIT